MYVKRLVDFAVPQEPSTLARKYKNNLGTMGGTHFLFPQENWWKLFRVERFPLSVKGQAAYKHGITHSRLI